MKKRVLFSVLIITILLILGCKSKPAPVNTPAVQQPASQNQSASSAQPQGNTSPAGTAQSSAVTLLPEATQSQASTTAAPPASTTQSSASTQLQTASSGAYNRHSSGIILDGARSYTVQRGDTLNRIARQMYMDGSLYPLIMMVSAYITNPDLIQPGLQLTIPDAAINLNDPAARQAINAYFLDIARFEEQRGRRGTAELILNHTK